MARDTDWKFARYVNYKQKLGGQRAGLRPAVEKYGEMQEETTR